MHGAAVEQPYMQLSMPLQSADWLDNQAWVVVAEMPMMLPPAETEIGQCRCRGCMAAALEVEAKWVQFRFEVQSHVRSSWACNSVTHFVVAGPFETRGHFDFVT